MVSPGIQEYVCNSSTAVNLEDRYTSRVRGICYRTSAWVPTTAELEALVDDFIAVSSVRKDSSAWTTFYSDSAKKDQDEERFVAAWASARWAERTGALIMRQRGSATVRYVRYNWDGNVPRMVQMQYREVDITAGFDPQRHLRLDRAWIGESRVVQSDATVRLARGFVESATYGYSLPSKKSTIGVGLRSGDTVRLICRLKTTNRDFIRTTDGWVETADLFDSQPIADGLSGCGLQHAERAARALGEPP